MSDSSAQGTISLSLTSGDTTGMAAPACIESVSSSSANTDVKVEVPRTSSLRGEKKAELPMEPITELSMLLDDLPADKTLPASDASWEALSIQQSERGVESEAKTRTTSPFRKILDSTENTVRSLPVL